MPKLVERIQKKCYKYDANAKNTSVKNSGKKKERKRKCIAIIYYKRKLGLFGRDDTRQARCINFIVVPQAEQVSKSTKIKKKQKAKRDGIRT